MKLGKPTWIIVIIISSLFMLITKNFSEPGRIIGSVLALILWPTIIVGIIILLGKVIKKPPKLKTQKVVFLSVWGFMLLTLFSASLNRSNRIDRSTAIQNCIEAAKKSVNYDIGGTLDLERYCDCTIDELLKTGRIEDSSALSEIQDENSILFNEVIMTCVKLALKDTLQEGYITGLKSKDTISVLNMPNKIKIKMSIGGEGRYFLFDTGASDILISKGFEKVLKEKNLIVQYMENELYEMANGDTIECRTALVNNIQIGQFIVDSTMVAIYDEEIEFILGKSFLDRFSSWSFTSSGNQLILEK
ncbi:MAG: retroviral-like aspartic protease family protein [Cyclobacteriaceae bacterium]